MASIINAATSGGLISTADTSGILQLQTAGTTAVTVDASQNVGVGTASPSAKLHVAGTGTVTGLVNSTNGGTASLSLLSSGVREWKINADSTFKFTVDGSEAARLTGGSSFQVANSVSVGNTTPSSDGAGITFPATQSASSNANTLDDYEEGTWSPTVIGSTTAGTVTYYGRVGSYTKIGNLVTFSLYLNWGSGTGTGDLQISGLPFTVAGGTHYPAVTIGKASYLALSASNVVTAYCVTSTTKFVFEQYPVGGGAPTSVPYDVSCGDTFISGSYQAA